ncbi:MAG TPA: PD-(D/E)XK nuclease family protein, partial [Planctomycetota bacterium]|nr:PD-(D/E)XK nuclease family protein [Planctomycetota bacterium]
THKVTLSTKVAGIEASASPAELRRAAVLKLGEARLGKAERGRCLSALAAVGESEKEEGRRSLPVLRRGLEGEAERDSWDPFGAHDGVLSHPEAVGELARRFGADYGFSITALEEYGGCPFAFLCHVVLGVEAPVEPPEELEAVDEGTILHRTLRQFYAERRERSRDVRIREDEVGTAQEHIRRIADAHLDRFHRRNPDLNEGLFRLQREAMHELLGEFVRAEAAARGTDRLGMIPRFFEVAFGLSVKRGVADPRSTSKRLVVESADGPSIGIVGKIDRIDVTEGVVGEAGRRGFRVIDYKRGRAPSGTRGIEEGTAFQMPVYLLAARDVILADETLEAVDARFYGLRDMKARPALALLKGTATGVQPVAGAEALMDAAVEHIRDYVGAIRKGQFPVLRRGTQACPGYCEFREICRYSELRAGKKTGDFKPWFEHRHPSERTEGGDE